MSFSANLPLSSFNQLREMLFTVAENNTGCDSQLSINNNYAIKQLLLNAISLKVIPLEISRKGF